MSKILIKKSDLDKAFFTSNKLGYLKEQISYLVKDYKVIENKANNEIEIISDKEKVNDVKHVLECLGVEFKLEEISLPSILKKTQSNVGKKILDFESIKDYYVVQFKDIQRTSIVSPEGKVIYDTDTWVDAINWIKRNTESKIKEESDEVLRQKQDINDLENDMYQAKIDGDKEKADDIKKDIDDAKDELDGMKESKLKESRRVLKKPYEFNNGIELLSYGLSPNGNHTVTILTPRGVKKSIQTNNPGLFKTHRILRGTFRDIDIDDLNIVGKELGEWIKRYGESTQKVKEADTEDIKAENPGILELPEDGFKDWTIDKLVSHFVKLAKSKGRDKISPAIQNLIRWNKNDNPEISSKAQSVFDKYDKELEKLGESKLKEYKTYKITYDDGSTSVTDMSDKVDLKTAQDYFIGKRFNIASYPNEKVVKAVKVEPFKEGRVKEETESYWFDFLNNAPQSLINDTITYYANKRRNWNMKKISLSKKDLDDLVNFQKALSKKGYSEKDFMSYVNESKVVEADKFLLWKKPTKKDIKVGDIVAYQDINGEYTKSAKVTKIDNNGFFHVGSGAYTADELRIKMKEAEDKVDIEKIIKDFIETKWSKNDDKGKTLNLLKGLVYSNDDRAKKFIKDLDDLSDTLNIEDYK